MNLIGRRLKQVRRLNRMATLCVVLYGGHKTKTTFSLSIRPTREKSPNTNVRAFHLAEKTSARPVIQHGATSVRFSKRR